MIVGVPNPSSIWSSKIAPTSAAAPWRAPAARPPGPPSSRCWRSNTARHPHGCRRRGHGAGSRRSRRSLYSRCSATSNAFSSIPSRSRSSRTATARAAGDRSRIGRNSDSPARCRARLGGRSARGEVLALRAQHGVDVEHRGAVDRLQRPDLEPRTVDFDDRPRADRSGSTIGEQVLKIPFWARFGSSRRSADENVARPSGRCHDQHRRRAARLPDHIASDNAGSITSQASGAFALRARRARSTNGDSTAPIGRTS